MGIRISHRSLERISEFPSMDGDPGEIRLDTIAYNLPTALR